MARRLAVLTTGRQDWGILRSTVVALRDSGPFELLLYVGGMHLDARFGRTVELVEADGISEYRELAFLGGSSDPAGEAARAMAAVAAALDEDRPEALLLVGDRSETLAAAVAASIVRVPIVHLHGGEETEGAIDNTFRHAITKLSHLHLTTHPVHAARVRQMGEADDAVHVVGPPGLDNLHRSDLPGRTDLLASLGLRDPAPDPLVAVTIHPTTLSDGPEDQEAAAVAAALDGIGAHVVVTMPNADAGGDAIGRLWERWAARRPDVVLVRSLGERRYWALMHAADVMVSNSSSGLIEAPAAHLPVVNVGDRQRGRLRHPMTLDVPPDAEQIRAALATATAPGYRAALREAAPVYPPGPCWPRILEILVGWRPPDPPRKPFVDREVVR